MRFIVVKFVTSLALIQGLYAAPIDDSVGKDIICFISTNDNVVSSALSTTEAIAATCTSNRNLDERQHEPILTRTKNQADIQQSSDSDPFQCRWENCNQSFESVTGLSQHVKSHTVDGQKYYNCKWKKCNYECYYISQLENHLRKHTKERPFVCQFDGCGKLFTQNANLKQHIKAVHSSKVQNFSPLQQEYESLVLNNGKVQQQEVLRCDWKNCNRDFDNTTLLTNHIKKDHIGEWKSRYECQWKDCSYATRFKNNIEMHIRTHAKERPFICSYNNCGKSFTESGNLKKHINYVHSSKCAFHCPLLQCDKKYSRIEDIRRHMFRHASTSNLSSSDIDSIWNAFRKKIPYSADISNRIELKERIIEKNTHESNIDRMDEFINESTETSTNVTEGDISGTKVNEIYLSDADLDSIFFAFHSADPDLVLPCVPFNTELNSVDESVTNLNVLTDLGEGNTEAANDATECISFPELDKDRMDFTKRPLEFDIEFDRASKKNKPTHLTFNSVELIHCKHPDQNSPLSLEHLLDFISKDLAYFIEQDAQ